MIKLHHVSKYFSIGDGQLAALHDITKTIQTGEYLTIIGPSGSGKSTLMYIMGLLDKPSQGQVLIRDKDTSTLSDDELSTLRNESVGFVFQQFNLINKLTVLENIILPAIYSRKSLAFNPMSKARELISRFGLDGKEQSYPNTLSGGQQQRVAIARALIMNPELILADEPTGNLDSKTGEAIMSLIQELNIREKVTVVVITHDPKIAKKSKRRVHIVDGKLRA